jgi:hypothetical protein
MFHVKHPNSPQSMPQIVFEYCFLICTLVRSLSHEGNTERVRIFRGLVGCWTKLEL